MKVLKGSLSITDFLPVSLFVSGDRIITPVTEIGLLGFNEAKAAEVLEVLSCIVCKPLSASESLFTLSRESGSFTLDFDKLEVSQKDGLIQFRDKKVGKDGLIQFSDKKVGLKLSNDDIVSSKYYSDQNNAWTTEVDWGANELAIMNSPTCNSSSEYRLYLSMVRDFKPTIFTGFFY